MKQAADRPIPDVFGAAIQGQRSEQQDSYRARWLESEKAWLLVLADGMGGHAAGGVASRLAADAFVAAFSEARAKGFGIKESFMLSLEEANLKIQQAQRASPETAGMGTTLVGGYLSGQGIAWISVGDSPLWVLHNGGITRLNEDHSLREIARHGAKGVANMLASVVNGEPITLINCHPDPVPLKFDDFILISSDGILTLEERDIADVAKTNVKYGCEGVARALLREVEKRGKTNQDNCAVLVASASDEQPSPTVDFRKEVAVAAVWAAIGSITVIIGYTAWSFI
jgi:PPM family protein phosphatase